MGSLPFLVFFSVLELAELKQAKEDFEETKRRHAMLMELYGAKEEQVEELKEDINEMKQLYRSQINDLVTRIEELQRNGKQ